MRLMVARRQNRPPPPGVIQFRAERYRRGLADLASGRLVRVLKMVSA